MEQVEVRYKKLSDIEWVIESTAPAPIAVIQQTMQFIDKSGKTHQVEKIVTDPPGNPEAPYYFYIKAITKS